MTQKNSRSLLWQLALAGGGYDLLLFVLLFLPAGTFDFGQAWVYWGLFTAYWRKVAPDFMERRLKVGPQAEKSRTEKILVALLLGYLAVWMAKRTIRPLIRLTSIPLT